LATQNSNSRTRTWIPELSIVLLVMC
jgi:hypothetical protein